MTFWFLWYNLDYARQCSIALWNGNWMGLANSHQIHIGYSKAFRIINLWKRKYQNDAFFTNEMCTFLSKPLNEHLEEKVKMNIKMNAPFIAESIIRFVRINSIYRNKAFIWRGIYRSYPMLHSHKVVADSCAFELMSVITFINQCK